MTTTDILDELKQKFKSKSVMASEILEYPSLKRFVHSFAFRPPNLLIDLGNELSDLDNSGESISFYVNDADQALDIIEKFLNIKS